MRARDGCSFSSRRAPLTAKRTPRTHKSSSILASLTCVQCISSKMAFSAGIGDRGALKSPRDESSFASITSPLRSVGAQMSSASDARGHLHRRFTTNNIPTLNTPLSPIGQQRRQAAEPAEFTTAVSDLCCPATFCERVGAAMAWGSYCSSESAIAPCYYNSPSLCSLGESLPSPAAAFPLLLLSSHSVKFQVKESSS